MSLIFSQASILIPEFRGFPQVTVEAHGHSQSMLFPALQKSIKFFTPKIFQQFRKYASSMCVPHTRVACRICAGCVLHVRALCRVASFAW
jgi:hypothetical protein